MNVDKVADKEKGQRAGLQDQGRCARCDTPIDPSAPGTPRTPCPTCGATARVFEEHITETLGLSDHWAELHERSGEAIGYSESERQGRASAATLGSDGVLRYSVSGSSPQGEEDTEFTCRILARRLTLEGEDSYDVVPGVEPVDRFLVKRGRPEEELGVQVVRADPSPTLWRQLSASGSVQRDVPVKDLVAALRAAIEHKEQNLPRSVREDLVLALDANRLPGYAFNAVVREFHWTHLAWAAGLGFNAIWLVGPEPSLTWRLDRA